MKERYPPAFLCSMTMIFHFKRELQKIEPFFIGNDENRLDNHAFSSFNTTQHETLKGVIKLNTFFEYEGIIGKAETAHLDRALREFFELAVTTRRMLGKQGYLLDKYLSCILSAVNSIGIRDSADEGLDSASELRQLCCDVMDSKTDRSGHPLYETVKLFIESHPISFQEDESRLEYYCACLIGEFVSYVAERFSLDKRNTLSRTADIVTLRDLYRKISAIIGGEEQMERLKRPLQR